MPWIIYVIIGFVVLILIPMAVKILPEYERGVIFRLGRLTGAKGPGFFLIIPLIDKMVKVDMRVITLDVPSHEAITKDNVAVRVNAVAYFKVVDPIAAKVKVLDHVSATSQLFQDALHNLLTQSARDELVRVDEVSKTLQSRIEQPPRTYGVEVTAVELKNIYFGEKYKCNVCGKEATVMKVGGGTLICCSQGMAKIG